MANKPQSETEVNQSVNSPSEASEVSVLESFAQTAVNTALGVGVAAAKQTHKLIEQATQTTGEVVNGLGKNWLLRKLSGVLNLNWLISASDSVDLETAEAAVNKLKREHPQESLSQIAHRIMVEKAAKAGGIGLATSILPGFAVALLAVDLAATTKLQTQMLYEIASVYGLDLKDSARKGEVLAIFGLALGGGRLLKVGGLGLLRNMPFAGAAIAASSNATMIYSLGYAACRYYTAKGDASTSLNSKETLAKLKTQSENYLKTAIAQEAVMDQILVHMILAAHPEKTWEEILPELQAANLSPTSLAAIAQNIKSPQPLDSLLNQLNRDFAIPLLVQCKKIAGLDSQTTPFEQRVIDAIAAKFNLENGE
jgi:uncharacterized protein (DUF697 family)